jgi:peptidylprolyl isomerase
MAVATALLQVAACSRSGTLPAQPLGDPQFRAERFIQAMATKAPDLVLDYSAASISDLEGYIERTYRDARAKRPDAQQQGDLGCYLGETIIKTVGGHWNSAGNAEIDGIRVIDRVFPLARVEKRFREGEGSSIESYYGATQRVSVNGTLVTTPSGLQYIDLIPRNGPSARAGQTVIIRYTGWLASTGQKVLDNSVDQRSFRLGQGEAIKGWDEGVAPMGLYGERRLIIPPDLAYGAAGRAHIPPNSTLIFDVRLEGRQ